ncbi:hypothetical protein HWV23_05815 [Natronomonas halophila]|uniref:hypothetical protein n=1 Tax=Natronomonas halophila TaxID=2747817 RepID=UPI0015B63B3E|nr:hypothetical protein [Natronomonas halophila]QLD85261.1 hypothetical protein HWV23_05815 [Natronomonas halophila]
MNRAGLASLTALVFVIALCVTAATGATAATETADTATCVGPVDRPANAETLVTTQGLQVVGNRYEKRPAMLAAYGPTARPVWSHDLDERGRFVGRSVADTPNGTLLVTQEGSHTVVELLDDERRPVWALRFGIGDGPRASIDVRDALLEPEGLLVADRDRLVRYDRETDRIVREWPVPAASRDNRTITGVASLSNGYLVTVAGENNGSVLAVGDAGVRWQVDGLQEPYSPQHLGGRVLFAEMGADRVVEMTPDGEVVWALTGLDRPRSAERLPRGTTLVSDRRNHRVLEIGPRGRVVWTAFAPWEPADATRTVDGKRQSVTAENVTGTYGVTAANASYDELAACEDGLLALAPNRTERATTLVEDGTDRVALGALIGSLVLVGALVARRRATA